ncbi:PREDICTED: uncharacterized protein LOC105567951 [Vollenhovia emeryi]|uniref:uncharacterized protein LOC105567951 n=1 Tax=Vollenhovia emeryi TaxID=411798 RepID=UPI0005F44817|nr:PREDICTED: uncharacterized protein LOC105567951 [Vollenhovia emeryi]
MANIKVAVRIRPVSVRELNLTGSAVVVRAESNEISLTNLKISSSKVGDSRERTRRYDFDYCFDSSDPEAKNYATQATIYETLGQSIMDAMFSGYNSCLVAYGQSASGKTYTMMGTKEDPGLIPRLCEGIFSKIEQKSEHERIYRVTVSYLEIYNERVRDLLKPSTSTSGLRVREHPRLGPYVQGLTHHVVRTLESLISYVEEGTKARKTASTLQNPSSSRSHALLTVDLSQETADAERPNGSGTCSSSRRQDATPRGGSRLHLVDLAGSESAATCSGVHRLKEGANINKSLVALGNVISALAERGSTGNRPGRRYIPYRDSSLTWLLKDALGGNATTIMLATISPASGSYNETAHTLRFAQRAQSVVNRPVVNEDPVERIIRELRAEVARLKSLLLEKDIDQTKAPCCCGKVQSSKDSATDPQYREEQESFNTWRSEESNHKDKTIRSKDNRVHDILPIRRFNSSDSVTAYEADNSGPIRKFNSFEHLRLSDRFVGNYNQAKVTELNDEDDEVVDEISEPVFVDIPTLVAVLIKPDDSLQESSTHIEEICSDEVQEDSIDADFIEGSNEDFEGTERIDDDPDDRSSSANSCILKDSEIVDLHQIASECPPASPASVGRSRPRAKFSKQNSVDLPSSNLSVSKKFGSIDGISKKREPAIVGVQRSHTNLEKRPTLPDRGKKLNNIREIDDRKANVKSGSIWRAIGSKDHLQRKSSNESDKSLKDSNRTGSYNNIGRKPSLESLKRKTSKDSSSSSSKDEQILISSLARDKLTRRKSSLDPDAVTSAVTVVGGLKHHTAIQKVKRAEIVAAVTERLYSSRKHTEETSMASSNTSGTRSPPEGIDVKMPGSLIARSRLQEISRKMLMKRRRITVDTQTEAASTLRFKDTACLTDEPKVVLQDAAVLTDDHADGDVAVIAIADRRLPVLRVKDMATLTDRRPQTSIFRCRDVGSLATDLDFDDYELHSPRNDSGILSDDAQNYAESNLSSADVSELYPEGGDKRVPCVDSSTNTFLASPGRNSAVQTPRLETASRQKDNSESRSYSKCCSLIHELSQHVRANSPEKNVISISLPETINITIESANGLESRIAVMDGSDAVEEKSKPISSDRAAQTDEEIKNGTGGSLLKDFTVKSTATQADGRVFRIENIFQDPRSKSYHDVTSDLKKEIAIKKSITFTSSLGTSSAIETKESGTETEWNGIYIDNVCQRTRPIPRGGLTQAFIIRKRSHSLNPRRSTQRFARHDLWRNWTLPCREKSSENSDYHRETTTMPSSAQQDTNLELIDNFFSSTINSECTFVATTPEETAQESRDQDSKDSCKNLKKSKSISLKNLLLNCDYNFSDDSLDYDEDNMANKSAEAKTMDSNDDMNYESFCPPDVVAHTKKEASKPSHGDSANVESSIDDDFDDTRIEFPKRKSAELSERNLIQDYKALILGTSSRIVDSDSEEEAKTRPLDNISKKKVSFSNRNNLEEMSDVTSRKVLASKRTSEVGLKPIIKKMKKKKPVVTESLDIIQSNVEDGQPLKQKTILSTKSEEVLPVLRENHESEDSEATLNDEKVEFSNENHREDSCNKVAEDNVIDEDTRSRAASKRNILEEYLNEAIIFMRNMNSINEYMSATNMLENYGKRRRRRGRRGNNSSTDKDYIEFRGRRVSLKDDTDKYLPDNDEVVAVESYAKCLKGIERLEACIDKVSKHNQVLRDKYGIDVESAGAKSSLASPSIGSEVSSIVDSSIHYRENIVSDNDAENCDESSLTKIPLPLLPATRIDMTQQSTLNGLEKYQALTEIDKRNLDDKNNNITTEDDLERKIFDQLMGAADFSKCWSLKQSRRERLRKISDLRSQSPTTYSKLRGTFQQDTHGILNFDQVSTAEDYLGHIRGIESSSWTLRKTQLSDQPDDTSLTTSIGFKIDSEEFCNESPEDYDNLSDIEASNEPTIFEIKHQDYLIDSTNSIVEQTPYMEKEIARRSRDSLRTELMNPRLGDSFTVDVKYPGSPRAKFLELLKERRRIVESSRGTNAF